MVEPGTLPDALIWFADTIATNMSSTSFYARYGAALILNSLLDSCIGVIEKAVKVHSATINGCCDAHENTREICIASLQMISNHKGLVLLDDLIEAYKTHYIAGKVSDLLFTRHFSHEWFHLMVNRIQAPC